MADHLDAEYRLLAEPQPFCVFFADIAPNTPIKMIRLKMMLFLQGSPFLDLQAAATRLVALPILKPELAIVLGRVSRPSVTKRIWQLTIHSLEEIVKPYNYSHGISEMDCLHRHTVHKAERLFLQRWRVQLRALYLLCMGGQHLARWVGRDEGQWTRRRRKV